MAATPGSRAPAASARRDDQPSALVACHFADGLWHVVDPAGWVSLGGSDLSSTGVPGAEADRVKAQDGAVGERRQDSALPERHDAVAGMARPVGAPEQHGCARGMRWEKAVAKLVADQLMGLGHHRHTIGASRVHRPGWAFRYPCGIRHAGR